jgi:hypothetical protein
MFHKDMSGHLLFPPPPESLYSDGFAIDKNPGCIHFLIVYAHFISGNHRKKGCSVPGLHQGRGDTGCKREVELAKIKQKSYLLAANPPART